MTPSLIVQPARLKAGTIYAYVNGQIQPIGVTRGTVANRFNSTGALDSVAANVPRLDYVFAGGIQGCPYWLVEGAATNGYWPSNMSADYSLVNMTRSGNIITETTTNGGHGFDGPSRASTINQLRAYGYIFKQLSGTTRRVRMRVSNNADGNILGGIFDASTGQRFTNVSRTGSWSLTGLSDGIINLGNGYWLLYCIGQTSVGTTNLIDLRLDNGTSSFSYAGSTGVSFECFGFQMELGSFPTSRINTTTGVVTRNADVILQTGLSAVIGQTTGAISGAFVVSGVGIRTIASLSDGTINNGITINIDASNNIIVGVVQAGVTRATLITSAPVASGIHGYCLTYEGGIFRLYVDGVLVDTETASNTPACSQLRLGSFVDGTQFMNGHIGAHVLANTAITASEAINLSLVR